MNLGVFDWGIVIIFFMAVTIVAAMSSKFSKCPSDFLVAGRCANRYMLTMAEGACGVGCISVIAAFEMYYKAGFTAVWWGLMLVPVTMIITLSGWVIYRFRQTRAMTLSQMLEMRYSRNFRIFAGILCWVSGVMNFGIFPAVGARFTLHFFGFSDSIMIGGFSVSMFPIIMMVLLGVSLLFTLLSGQISIMLTDFLMGAFILISSVAIIGYLFFIKFEWPQIMTALKTAEAGKSLINPLDTGKLKDFNFFYFAIAIFSMFINRLSWQGSQAYNSSGINAHETRMGKIIGLWRGLSWNLLFMLVPICAFTFLHNTAFAEQAQIAKDNIASIDNSYLQQQLTVSISLSKILPVGLLGVFATIMLMASITTMDTYLHSWGSIFIQDVLIPIRKKPFKPQQHLVILRVSIIMVAIFAFTFSLLFPQTQEIYYFFALTGAIFMGGAGSVIIGGLYWKKGTTAAAWSAMTVGTLTAVGGMICEKLIPDFWLDGQVVFFLSMLSSIVVYIVVSLITIKEDFNLDRMLNRGKYVVEEDRTQAQFKKVSGFRKMLGITNEFTNMDKIVYYSTIVYSGLQIAVFVVVTPYVIVKKVSDDWWGVFWFYYLWINIIILVITAIWITIGGFSGLINMLTALKHLKRDYHEDGSVPEKKDVIELIKKDF